ncbi:g1008 [Coccomyxa viridis]|uniref:G1008 protein n=1 Tax=Coccomyxa viridis TaxID=1274662 RepID=A0ABP1FJZ2_9CHLO
MAHLQDPLNNRHTLRVIIGYNNGPWPAAPGGIMAVPEAWDSTRVVNLESFDTLGVSLRLELAEAWDIVREFRRRKWRDALSGTLFSRLWANTGAMAGMFCAALEDGQHQLQGAHYIEGLFDQTMIARLAEGQLMSALPKHLVSFLGRTTCFPRPMLQLLERLLRYPFYVKQEDPEWPLALSMYLTGFLHRRTIGGVDGICFFSLMHRAYFTSSYYGFRLSGMVDTVEEFTLLLTHGSQRMDPEDLATTLGRSRDNAPYEDTYDFGCTNGLISTMPIGARTSRRVGPLLGSPGFIDALIEVTAFAVHLQRYLLFRYGVEYLRDSDRPTGHHGRFFTSYSMMHFSRWAIIDFRHVECSRPWPPPLANYYIIEFFDQYRRANLYRSDGQEWVLVSELLMFHRVPMIGY